MRELLEEELDRVGGGVGEIVYHDNRDQLKWGNNGFGNGADHQNLAPGHSGMRRGLKGRLHVGNGSGMHDSLGDDQGPR